MILRVGLTGGIGSGKTTIAGIFEVLGIPVYYADVEARRLMNEDPELKAAIVRHFGNASYKEGLLDRRYISQLVFGNKEQLRILNGLVHPATIRDGNRWMQQQTTPYAIKEAALIFETSLQQELDKVIGVYAPETLRMQRAINRDHISAEEVLKRMSSQMNEDEKMKRCDFVIHNDEAQPVLPQVLQLHHQLLRLASEKR